MAHDHHESNGNRKAARKGAFWLGLGIGCVLTSLFYSFLTDLREGGSGGGETHRELRLAHVLDQSHPVHKAMEYMAGELRRLSGGELELLIFPNGQLGSETDSIEQVRRGALAMVKTSASAMEGFIPEMAVFGLPYLFRDDRHYWRVLEGETGQELLQKGGRHGLRGLCYYTAGARSFYTTDQAVLAPRDLNKLKIRVMRSNVAMRTIEQLGASPTPIPWGELYTALQQGMVDGAENNPPSLYSSRHYEVVRHYSLNEHTRIPDIIMISGRIWQELSPRERDWLQEAADRSVAYQRELWRERTAWSLGRIEEAGVRIHEVDKEPFAELAREVYAAFSGTPIADYIARIQEVRE